MTETTCIKIQGGNVRGETIELGNHEKRDIIYGGAFLHNCTIDICGPAFDIFDANFLNCRIEIRRSISNVRFLETVFERCTFEGKLVGCRFGFRRGESKSPNAYYRNCDFSKATLDLCDFFAGDVDSVIWPMWPNFTVLNPIKNKQDWLTIPFPDELKGMQNVVSGDALAGISQVAGEQIDQSIDNAPQAITVDLAGYDVIDPEHVWQLIQKKKYIVFEGKDRK